jgi:predicted MFS family arabinose efflux permease
LNPWRGLRALPREIWFLSLATLINRAGTMVLPFLTLYLTVDRRFSASTAALALTIYGIAAIIIAPLAGRLSDHLGGLRIIKLSLFSSGAILFAFPLVNSIEGIYALCGLWAIAAEAFRPPSMSIIGDLAGPSQRKAAFALSRLAINLGMSIGPVVGGFLAMHSFKLLFYVDGATSILAGMLVAVLPWRSLKQPDQAQTDNIDSARPLSASIVSNEPVPALKYTDVLKDRRFILFLIAMLPIELVFFQSLAAMPLFLVRDLHFTEAGFGALLAINTVIIILVEVPLNSAMADWPHRSSLSLGAMLVGAGFGALVFVKGTLGAAVTILLWTFGEMILLPASSAFVSDIAPREQSGSYMGLYTMGFSVALAIGPWLGAHMLDNFGPATVWIATFCCGCITALMVWLLPGPRSGQGSV